MLTNVTINSVAVTGGGIAKSTCQTITGIWLVYKCSEGRCRLVCTALFIASAGIPEGVRNAECRPSLIISVKLS